MQFQGRDVIEIVTGPSRLLVDPEAAACSAGITMAVR